MDLLTAGLAPEKFPKSFQDVIHATRSSDIPLLWIDCYCILQGQDAESERDWQKESVQMDSIYWNGLINLGSSHATGPHIGAFSSRTRSSMEAQFFSWRPTSDSSKAVFSIEAIGVDVDPRQKGLYQLPLFKRGWCVREKVLCPRMLHFGKVQLHWECDQEFYFSECRPVSISDRYGKPLEADPMHRPVFDLANLPNDVHNRFKVAKIAVKSVVHCHAWDKIIGSFTETQLTYPDKDKLRTLQGIANKFRQLSLTMPQMSIVGAAISLSCRTSSRGRVAVPTCARVFTARLHGLGTRAMHRYGLTTNLVTLTELWRTAPSPKNQA